MSCLVYDCDGETDENPYSLVEKIERSIDFWCSGGQIWFRPAWKWRGTVKQNPYTEIIETFFNVREIFHDAEMWGFRAEFTENGDLGVWKEEGMANSDFANIISNYIDNYHQY